MEHLTSEIPRTSRTGATYAHVRELEAPLGALTKATRLLPAVTPVNAAAERARLREHAARGLPLVPDWTLRPVRVPSNAFHAIDELRRRAHALPGEALHLARLDELELDLRLLDALDRPGEARAIARRRFGTGATQVPADEGTTTLAATARAWLDATPPAADPPAPAVDLAVVVREVADAAGLDVAIRHDPRLAAAAASGERTVFVGTRAVPAPAALRLAVHEVLGHLVSAHHGRRQPLRILEWGTAGAFADQEGVALSLEARYGLFDGARRRTVAARVLVTDFVHGGATFEEAVTRLRRDEGFSLDEALALAERGYRGGGATRDVGYLSGWLRVQRALATGRCRLEELQVGRVSLDALDAIDALARDGWALCAEAPQPRLNLSRSFCSTSGGTTPFKFPPS